MGSNYNYSSAHYNNVKYNRELRVVSILCCFSEIEIEIKPLLLRVLIFVGVELAVDILLII